MRLSVLRAEAQKHIVSYQNVSVKAIIYPETILLEVVRAAPVAVVHIAGINKANMGKPDQMKLSDKLVLISGGSSGIGLSLAKKMAEKGASLLSCARRENQLAAAKEEISKSFIDDRQFVETVSVDMRSFETVKNTLSPVFDRFGIPDIVVHSAGVVYPAVFEKISNEQFHWMMDTNYFGAVNLFQTVVPKMKERKSGHIVAMGSAASFIGIWGYSAYSGSKYAIRGLCDVLRSELKPYHVQVSIVFPPDTDTPQLAYENQFKPKITREVSGTIKPLSPDFVASKILQGIQQKKYVIMPDRDTKLLFTASNLLGTGIHRVLDYFTLKAFNKYGPDA